MTIDVSDALKKAILQRRTVADGGKNEAVQKIVAVATDKLANWNTQLVEFVNNTLDDSKLKDTLAEAKQENVLPEVLEAFNQKFATKIKSLCKTDNILERGLKQALTHQGFNSTGHSDFTLTKNLCEDLLAFKTHVLTKLQKNYDAAVIQAKNSPLLVACIYTYSQGSVTAKQMNADYQIAIKKIYSESEMKDGYENKYVYKQPPIYPWMHFTKTTTPEILKTEFDVTLGLAEPVKKSKAKAKKS